MSSNRPDSTDSSALLLDDTGMKCPMPLLKTRQRLRELQPGNVLLVRASDPGALRDIPAWLRQTPHALVQLDEMDGVLRFLIRTGGIG